MKKMAYVLVLSGVMTLTGACAHSYQVPVQGYQYTAMEERTIRVRGHGTSVPRPDLTQSQQKLMAIRASRLDAYRNLAEELYGMRLEGGTSLRDMAGERDRVRSYIDKKIRGARVIDVALIEDDIYETTLEYTVGHDFYRCVAAPHLCQPARPVAPPQPVVTRQYCGASPCPPTRVVPLQAPRQRVPEWQHCTEPYCSQAPYYYYQR
ncbi:LPP20 family lipoprotein [Ectothiorhodospira variabilis]